MKSPEHATLGAIASLLLVFALPVSVPLEAAVLFGYGVLLSVFVDLDHFVVARYHAGDWSHLRRCVTDPVFAFTEQEQVFDGVDTRTLEVHRLLSHSLVGGALVGVLALFAPVYALFTAGVLYVHVVADLLRDGEIA
ncbi:metal-dependent hydrolase [Halorussus sp. MSC15.2]|uniref:metal-dependent hydrolase n=1 Tax=Halorussus sp. MSC15.2 TaxID=2283638 RepID=UPI0013CFEFCC|nr:metal-dependent hydrolase [Halorussus sp. MSC15.2]NEU57132.1 hypothetical protein [Halorussus sp. MSC15.2]